MARFWNGYQWREAADEQPKPELQPEPAPAPIPARLDRAFKRHHVHTFVNDVCECGERED